MKPLAGALALLVLVVWLAVVAPPAGAAPPTTWWNTSWSMRTQITVNAADALASGYSVSLTFSHAALVTAGNSLASGDDVRVVRWNGVAWTELDRVLDSGSTWNVSSTRLWFRTAAAIGASSTDTSYWLYYGNAAAGSPPVNGDNVFDLWDDFSSGAINAAKWNTITDTGIAPSVVGGELRLSGTTQASSAYTPVGIYSLANFTNGYATESRFRIVSQSTTARDNWKANFGIDGHYLMVNSQVSSAKRVQYWNGSWTDVGPSGLTGTTFGFQRVTQTVSPGDVAQHFENGVLQTSRPVVTTGYAAQFEYSPDVDNGGETFDVRFDDLAVRKFVANEPTLTLGSDDGAGARIPVGVDIPPAMTFSVVGRNSACNGLANTIGASATGTGVPLGRTTAATRAAGAQDLSVTTNGSGGFTVALRATSPAAPVMTGSGGGGRRIADAAAGPLPNVGIEAFGYTTDDAGGGIAPGNVAPVPASSGSTVVMASATPTVRTSCVGYFASASGTTPADSYQTTIIYTAVPTF